jgi:hypothetical protein
MAGRLEDWVQKQREEEPDNGGRRRSTRLRELETRRAIMQSMPGAFGDDENA